MATMICLDFTLFIPGQTMPSTFVLAGFGFAKAVGGPGLIISSDQSVLALRFPDPGLKVTLPAPSTRLRLKIGVFASPVKVAAIGVTGTVLATALISGPNAYVTKNFTLTKKAVAVLLTGGTNEASLARICVWI